MPVSPLNVTLDAAAPRALGRWFLLSTVLGLPACGDEADRSPSRQAPATPTPVEASPSETGTPAEPRALEPAAEGETTEAAPAEPESTLPCEVSWANGSVLSFAHEDAGGSVEIDHDGDGEPDTCGSYERADGKTTAIRIDEGCKGETSLEISVAPGAEGNVARGEVVPVGGKTREITIVHLPSVTGLDPGYVLQAARKAVKLELTDGRVRKATVRRPAEGPALVASFTYDDAARIATIEEDFERDGDRDRVFTYAYDEHGRLQTVKVTLGVGQTQREEVAQVRYRCPPR